MSRTQPYFIPIAFLCGLVIAPTPVLAADPPLVQGAPMEDRGVETLITEVVELAGEIPELAGRRLRLRLLRIEPGGYTRVHNHRNWPAVFYVLKGATTVFYGDGTVKRVAAGRSGYANRYTVHWYRNNEKIAAVFVTADIYPAVQAEVGKADGYESDWRHGVVIR